MSLEGATDMDKLKSLSAKKYADQAIWFMNGYWNELFTTEKERESLWDSVQIFIGIDKKKDKGCELDEFEAHRFLEKNGETLSVRDMREFLRSVDIDFNKMVSLTEYLVSKHKVKWNELVHKAQAFDKKAQEEVDAARALVDEARASAEVALKEQQASNIAANEVKFALGKVLSEEKKYKHQLEKLKSESEDMKLGIVKRNAAKNKLSQLKEKPTLPLQRAKITLTAAEKKAAKALKKARAAKAAAEKAFAEAEANLEALLKKYSSGGGEGTKWWLRREFEEAKKKMPKHKLKKLAKELKKVTDK